MIVEKLLKNIRCFIFEREKKLTTRHTKKYARARDVFTVRRMVRCNFVRNIIYGFCSVEWWWERKKPSFKCKNRKITFLVLLTEHIYCIFVCHNFFPFKWNMMFKCLLYFFLVQPLIKTFHFFSRFSVFSPSSSFRYVMQNSFDFSRKILEWKFQWMGTTVNFSIALRWQKESLG